MDSTKYAALRNFIAKDCSEIMTEVRKDKKKMPLLEEACRKYLKEFFAGQDEDEIIKAVKEDLFGYSVLTPLIEDPYITDITIHDWDNIRVKAKGCRSDSGVRFASEEHYKRFIESVATLNRVNTSVQNAISRFTDRKSSDNFILRFTLATPKVITDEKHEMVIRKVPYDFPEMDDLEQAGMFPGHIKDLLMERWREGSVLICGPNASGKTYLLNALKETTPEDKAVLVMQQAEELTAKRHKDMTFMRTVEGGSSDSSLRYTLCDLSIAGLTMDKDYFIIGEIKGGEAMYAINSCYTGSHFGGTIHAFNSRVALDKMADYAMYESRYTKDELMKMLVSIDTVVYVQGFKVREISYVKGYSSQTGQIEYDTIYRYGE